MGKYLIDWGDWWLGFFGGIIFMSLWVGFTAKFTNYRKKIEKREYYSLWDTTKAILIATFLVGFFFFSIKQWVDGRSWGLGLFNGAFFMVWATLCYKSLEKSRKEKQEMEIWDLLYEENKEEALKILLEERKNFDFDIGNAIMAAIFGGLVVVFFMFIFGYWVNLKSFWFWFYWAIVYFILFMILIDENKEEKNKTKKIIKTALLTSVIVGFFIMIISYYYESH